MTQIVVQQVQQNLFIDNIENDSEMGPEMDPNTRFICIVLRLLRPCSGMLTLGSGYGGSCSRSDTKRNQPKKN